MLRCTRNAFPFGLAAPGPALTRKFLLPVRFRYIPHPVPHSFPSCCIFMSLFQRAKVCTNSTRHRAKEMESFPFKNDHLEQRAAFMSFLLITYSRPIRRIPFRSNGLPQPSFVFYCILFYFSPPPLLKPTRATIDSARRVSAGFLAAFFYNSMFDLFLLPFSSVIFAAYKERTHPEERGCHRRNVKTFCPPYSL